MCLLFRPDLPLPLRLHLRADLPLSPLLPLHDIHGCLSLFLFEFAIAASSSTLVLLFFRVCSSVTFFSTEK
ncbi:hypothetical protein AHAS_Ahas01G0230500 [Arachis hypogaea]